MSLRFLSIILYAVEGVTPESVAVLVGVDSSLRIYPEIFLIQDPLRSYHHLKMILLEFTFLRIRTCVIYSVMLYLSYGKLLLLFGG